MEKTIDRKFLTNALTYEKYISLVEDCLKKGKVTGAHQSAELTQYGKLNLHRMQRIHKTVALLGETKDVINRIDKPQTWFILTESWCGDAAQIIPVLDAMAKLNSNVEIKLLLRDENPGLMDQYLTHGKSRSIPKLIVTDTQNLAELFHWGPRPAILQSKMNEWVADEMPFEEMKEQLHLWYARDKSVHTQQEIIALMKAHV